MNRFWQIIILVALLTGGAVFIARALNNRPGGTAKQTLPADTKTTAKVGTAIGEAAPDFQLAMIDGASASLAGLRGQPAVLVFWTAWCPTCKEEAPRFNELAAKYEPRGVRVVGINIQDSMARTQSGIKDFGIRYAVARDADASVARRYNVTGTPTVVFLDKLGAVRYRANALPDDYSEKLDALIETQ